MTAPPAGREEDPRPADGFLDDIRLARLEMPSLLRRLRKLPFDGALYRLEGEGWSLAGAVWIVNDAAERFVVGDARRFVDPNGDAYADAGIRTEDLRRIGEAWTIAGGVATPETVLTAAIVYRRTGAPAEPGSDLFVETYRGLVKTRSR